MDLNKLITKRIKEYALDGEVDLLDKYGFLFNMIAKDYAEAINYIPCCKGEAEQLPIARCGCEEPDPTEIKVCVQCDGYVEQAIAYNVLCMNSAT